MRNHSGEQRADRVRTDSAFSWFDGAAALAAVLVVAIQLWQPAPVGLMQADSPSYLEFSATRTVGYPAFLRVAEALPGGLNTLPALQLGLYGLASVLLVSAFRRLSGSQVGGGLLLALLLGNGQVTRLSFMIMTEALFLSCFMLQLAALCRLVRVPDWRTLALVSLTAGVSVLIRPVAYALAISLPVAMWWIWRAGRSAIGTLAVGILPYLAAVGVGMAGYHAEHGVWRTQSFLGSNLFGKAAAIVPIVGLERDDGAVRDDGALGWLAAAVAPDRAVIERAPLAFDRFRLLVPYYDLWRAKLGGVLPMRSGAARDDPIAVDRAMLEISLAAIAAAPRAFLGDVALNLAALWWLPDAMTHAQLARFRAMLAALGPLPDLGSYPPWHQEHNDAAIWALHGLMMVALASSLWWGWSVAACVLARAPPSPLAMIGLLAGSCVHATFLLTAILQAGLPRYVWAMWPALAILAVSGILAAARGARAVMAR